MQIVHQCTYVRKVYHVSVCVTTDFNLLRQSPLHHLLYSSGVSKMADLMWGGVPFTIPSSTAMKYLSGAVQVKVKFYPKNKVMAYTQVILIKVFISVESKVR